MKKRNLFLYAVSLIVGLSETAQMNAGSSSALSASAMLQVTSTNKGFLSPQVALTGLLDVSTITSPATGLLVYCTGTNLIPIGDQQRHYEEPRYKVSRDAQTNEITPRPGGPAVVVASS